MFEHKLLAVNRGDLTRQRFGKPLSEITTDDLNKGVDRNRIYEAAMIVFEDANGMLKILKSRFNLRRLEEENPVTNKPRES